MGHYIRAVFEAGLAEKEAGPRLLGCLHPYGTSK